MAPQARGVGANALWLAAGRDRAACGLCLLRLWSSGPRAHAVGLVADLLERGAIGRARVGAAEKEAAKKEKLVAKEAAKAEKEAMAEQDLRNGLDMLADLGAKINAEVVVS